MKKMSISRAVGIGLLLLAEVVFAQIGVMTSGQDVKIGKDGSVQVRTSSAPPVSGRNNASLTVGEISGDADIEGVTVINGRVSIDGKDVPQNVTRYKSPRTGKVYLIQRNGGNVSVSEAGGANERTP